MLAPATDRFRHSDSGISGVRPTRSSRASCTTKYPARAAAPHSSPTVRADPQA